MNCKTKNRIRPPSSRDRRSGFSLDGSLRLHPSRLAAARRLSPACRNGDAWITPGFLGDHVRSRRRTTWTGWDTSEHYDLVVVGAGISRLTAAYLDRKAQPDARVLVLDNHDDLSATRSVMSFRLVGKRELRFYDYYDQSLYERLGLDYAIAFDEKTSGSADWSVAMAAGSGGSLLKLHR